MTEEPKAQVGPSYIRTCTCVQCGDCGGTGNIEVPTSGYPEWELESCLTCGGCGYSEVCDFCGEEYGA